MYFLHRLILSGSVFVCCIAPRLLSHCDGVCASFGRGERVVVIGVSNGGVPAFELCSRLRPRVSSLHLAFISSVPSERQQADARAKNGPGWPADMVVGVLASLGEEVT